MRELHTLNLIPDENMAQYAPFPRVYLEAFQPREIFSGEPSPLDQPRVFTETDFEYDDGNRTMNTIVVFAVGLCAMFLGCGSAAAYVVLAGKY